VREAGEARRHAEQGGREGGGEDGRGRTERDPAATLPVRAVRVRGEPVEQVDELPRARWTVRRVLGHAVGDERAQGLGHCLRRDRRGLVHAPERGGVPRGVRRGAGDAFEEDAGGGVDIRRGSGRGTVPLLGGHVRGGPRERALSRQDGDAEVDELAVPVGRHQDVRGFVVAVDHVDGVRGRQPQQRTLEHGEGGFGGQRTGVAAQHVPEGDAVDRLQDDRRAPWRLDVLVQPGHVRVRHPGEHVDLVTEHRPMPSVVQQLGRQILDRHQLARGDTTGQHDPSLGAGAQLTQFFEAVSLPAAHPGRDSVCTSPTARVVSVVRDIVEFGLQSPPRSSQTPSHVQWTYHVMVTEMA
jgi:hypothetical protein